MSVQALVLDGVYHDAGEETPDEEAHEGRLVEHRRNERPVGVGLRLLVDVELLARLPGYAMLASAPRMKSVANR